MPEDATNPTPRRRMSLQKKLWLAGLGFPTLLLIALTAYMAHRAPTIRLIEWIESPQERRTAMGPQTNGWLTVKLPWPFDESTATSFNAPLPPLHRHFGVIQIIDVSNAELSPEIVESISRITSLRSLDIGTMGEISEKDLRPLANLKNLRHLHMGYGFRFNITDATLEWVGTLDRLGDLSFMSADFTEEGIDHLSRLTSLYSLKVLSQDRLEHPGVLFRRFPNLELLILELKSDCPKCLRAVSSLEKMQHLTITSGTGFSGESLALLHNMKSLRTIDLSGPAPAEAIDLLRANLPGTKVAHFNSPEDRIPAPLRAKMEQELKRLQEQLKAVPEQE